MNDKIINDCVNALAKQESWAYTAGFLQAQLGMVIAQLPKTKQKLVMADFERAIGSKVKVKVKSLMSGEEVEIPWHQQGTSMDPSQERYWSA